MSLRRVLLATASSGSRGGGELYLLPLAKGLRRLGHDVTCWMSSDPHMDELDSKLRPHAEVVRSAYRNTYHRPARALGAWLDRRTTRRIADEFRALRPAVIHVNKQNLEDGLDLLSGASLSGVPAVATIHITRTMKSLGARTAWLRDAVARRAINSAGLHCIASAEKCGRDLKVALGAGSKIPITCVLNGVEDASLASDRQAVRDEWNVRDDDLVLGTAARIEHQKNPLFLLDVLPHLPEHVKLVWVGDGRLRQAMEQKIVERKLTGRVHIDGWRDDAERRLSGMDLFVLPSLYEGLPFVILEAMSVSLPIVASRVDGIDQAILDGRTGFVLGIDDAGAWTARMQELIENESLRAAFGAAARRRYAEHFSTSAMAAATCDVYRRVLEQQA